MKQAAAAQLEWLSKFEKLLSKIVQKPSIFKVFPEKSIETEKCVPPAMRDHERHQGFLQNSRSQGLQDSVPPQFHSSNGLVLPRVFSNLKESGRRESAERRRPYPVQEEDAHFSARLSSSVPQFCLCTLGWGTR